MLALIDSVGSSQTRKQQRALPDVLEVFENDFASADSDAGAFFNIDLGDHTVFNDG
jgi:hypothetical protein